MILVGAGLCSARQTAAFSGKTAAHAYALTHFAVGVDAHIDPAECTVFTEICGEFVVAQRADRVVGLYGKTFNFHVSW